MQSCLANSLILHVWMERECYSSWVWFIIWLWFVVMAFKFSWVRFSPKWLKRKQRLVDCVTFGMQVVATEKIKIKNINIIDHMIRNLEQHCNCYNLLFVFRQVIFMARDGPLYACVHVCTCNDVHACMHVFASQVLNAWVKIHKLP